MRAAVTVLILAAAAVGQGAKDVYGDPLPRGAVARMGTVRLRHGGGVEHLVFSPDGKYLATADGAGVVRLLRTKDESEVTRLAWAWHMWDFRYAVRALAFGPDGVLRAFRAYDRKVQLWDGKEETSIELAHGDSMELVSGAAFSRDGKLLAAAAEHGVEVWDLATGKRKPGFQAAGHEPDSVAFAPDDATLASAGEGILILWDARTGSVRARIEIGNGKDWQTVAWSRGGKLVACAGHRSTVRIWSARTGKKALTLEVPEAPQCLAFSKDDRTIAVGTNGGKLGLYDAATGEQRLLVEAHRVGVNTLAYGPKGRIASGSQDNTVVFWDPKTVKRVSEASGHIAAVLCLAISPDGRKVLSGSIDFSARLWDARSGKPLLVLSGHHAPVLSADFSADGKSLLTGDWNGRVRLWSAATGEKQGSLSAQTTPIVLAAFLPREEQVLTAGARSWIRVHSVDRKALVSRIPWHHGTLFSAALSQDGSTVAAGGWKRLRTWTVPTGEPRLDVVLKSRALAIAFAPDGKHVAVGLADWGVHLIETGSGKLAGKLYGHKQKVMTVTFSQDGKRIASGSEDRTIRIWDVGTKAEIATLSGHAGTVTRVAFLPDGKHLVSASEDTTLLVWRLP